MKKSLKSALYTNPLQSIDQEKKSGIEGCVIYKYTYKSPHTKKRCLDFEQFDTEQNEKSSHTVSKSD